MRISRLRWGILLARVTAMRGTCLRRQVGCVLVDKLGHVLATGYNGVAAGQPHCNEVERTTNGVPHHPHACPGACAPSGTNLDGCYAIHAEQNAMLQCKDVQAIDTCYCTASPCITCVKLLLNTGCQTIVFEEAYPHGEAKDLWVKAGRGWVQANQRISFHDTLQVLTKGGEADATQEGQEQGDHPAEHPA